MIAATIAKELGVKQSQIETALTLLAEGNTVPFIARYRKEATGGLDDSQLRIIEERASYLRELEERKHSIAEAIEEQGKLTDELRRKIFECDTKARLEDLYLPYKNAVKLRLIMHAKLALKHWLMSSSRILALIPSSALSRI